jgi:hypothetical protein
LLFFVFVISFLFHLFYFLICEIFFKKGMPTGIPASPQNG